MNYKEVLSRITGLSVPVFGVLWNPPQPEIAIARRVLAFLEDRRVFYNPYHLEVAEQCIHSVLEIRRFLTEAIGQLPGDLKLGGHLRDIRAACRTILDETAPGARRVLRPHWGGPFESSFLAQIEPVRRILGKT